MSPEVVAEVGDVLNRPKIRRKFPALTDGAVETFLQDTVSRAVMLSEVPETFGLERDPKDERYINLALASKASYLVTWDRDLLDLMNDEGFRQQFPQLTILEPPALLRLFPQISRRGCAAMNPIDLAVIAVYIAGCTVARGLAGLAIARVEGLFPRREQHPGLGRDDLDRRDGDEYRRRS